MNFSASRETDPIAQAAADWVLRHDRGLTGAEQDEFSNWLSADPRHKAAWAEHRWGWDEIDRLAGLQTSLHAEPDPDLFAPARAPRRIFPARRLAPIALLAAASIALAVLFLAERRAEVAADVPRATIAMIEQRTLSDGSVVELNRGALVTESFTGAERRVALLRGEAHFSVVKDVGRPFIVEAGGVAVRAVGTAFNVRLDSSSVEVMVTEGRVGVARNDAAARVTSALFLDASERTVVSLAPAAPAPQVSVVSPAEIEARLAWKPRILDFTAAPLAQIVAEFNRCNPVHLSLQDESLGGLRLSAAFRSDNVEGFVRLLESDFGVRAVRGAGDTIALSRK